MIWAWALLIIISTDSGVTTERYEYPSETSCQAEATRMSKELSSDDVSVTTSCNRISIPFNMPDRSKQQVSRPSGSRAPVTTITSITTTIHKRH